MSLRLVCKQLRLRACAFRTHDCDERRLTGNSIFARRFAHLTWFTFDIEKVVGDLVSEADILRKIKQVLPNLWRGAAHDRAGFASERNQCARLGTLKPRDVARVDRLTLA